MGVTISIEKLIEEDTKDLTQKVRSDDYMDVDCSCRKELQIIAEKIESLIMELKPSLSNEQLIELMKEECIPDSLYHLVKKLVPEFYRKNRDVGRKALELAIFLDEIVIPNYCGAYDLEDFSYVIHSAKNLVLKEATEKFEAKIKAKNYLKYAKGANEEETAKNRNQAIAEKINALKTALQPHLPERKFQQLLYAGSDETLELLGGIVYDLYEDDQMNAFNTAIELRAVIDCLKFDYSANRYQTAVADRVETSTYDSYLKDFETSDGNDEYVYTYLSDFDPKIVKRFKKYEKIISSPNYFQEPEIFDDYNGTVSKKLENLKDELKPYLSEIGYQKLKSANANETSDMLDHLIVRLEKYGKVAFDKAIEIQALIKVVINQENQSIQTAVEKYRKKVMAEAYLDHDEASDDDEHENLRIALNKKFESLKMALKPYLPTNEFNELLNGDPLTVLEILETLIPRLYYQKPKSAAFNIAIELKVFIEDRIFNFVEQELFNDSHVDDQTTTEITEELDEDEIEMKEEYLKKKAIYDSYVKDYTGDTDELDDENGYVVYFAYHDMEEKNFKKFMKKFKAKNYIPAKNFEERRQMIANQLANLKTALKPYLTEAGYKKLLGTNPADLPWLLQELGTRFYQNKNRDAIVAAAELHAFIATVVRDFAAQDMHVDEYRKKVMAENYLGNYERYSEAIYVKMHQLKTALKPYITKKEYLKLLIASPLGTLEILMDLIAKFYYDEQNTTATAIAIELKMLIKCRVVESHIYDYY